MAQVGLSLVVGPAHAGKVALLLERYLALLDRDPWLIVPNRADVERVERELVGAGGRCSPGRSATFDALFEHLARGEVDPGGAVGDGGAQRSCVRASIAASRTRAWAVARVRRLRRRPGGRARRSSRRALARRRAISTEPVARSSVHTAPSSMRLGLWDRARYAAGRSSG